MNSKQYLEQVIKIAQALMTKHDEKNYLETMATISGAINYTNDRTTGSAPTSAKFEEVVCKAADLETAILSEYAELLDLHAEVRKVILAVEDLDIRNTLAEKFLCHTQEDVIAFKFGVSKKTVQRRLDKGYADVSKLTGYPEPPRQRMPARERHGIAREMLRRYTEE